MKYTTEQREEIKTWIMELYIVGIRKTKELKAILLKDKKFDVSERHIRRLRKDVRKETINSSQFDRNEQIGLGIARLESLYRKCITAEDMRGALAVQRELNELLGLKVLQIEHSAKTPFATWLQNLPLPKTNSKKSPNGKKKPSDKEPANGASGGESG